LHFALDNAGRSIEARMAMMAITSSNSIRVKPWRDVSSLRAAELRTGHHDRRSVK
jgi:hypothetical protein